MDDDADENKYSLADSEGGNLSYEDDENDSDWDPSTDPNTLYCICKKPHGKR